MSSQPKEKEKKPAKPKPSARSRSRQMLLQALYQWQISKDSINEIEVQFRNNRDFDKIDGDYFHKLLHGVAAEVGELDNTMSPLLDRPITQLDPVEISVLRIGCFELLRCKDVPYRVVINESIELAKCFGAQDSHRYVNGILDKLAPRLRYEEVSSRRERS